MLDQEEVSFALASLFYFFVYLSCKEIGDVLNRSRFMTMEQNDGLLLYNSSLFIPYLNALPIHSPPPPYTALMAKLKPVYLNLKYPCRLKELKYFTQRLWHLFFPCKVSSLSKDTLIYYKKSVLRFTFGQLLYRERRRKREA